ncbi:MAG: DUF2062 domain-containing protein [Desulfobacteraceae bacterium]|nr:DUF2062 domain-containing protein [Desulfobacteraceae bacterium]
MNRIRNNIPPKTTTESLKIRLRFFLKRVRRLNGDPHYIATGLAIGVFVAVTPTIPFHTVIALALAIIFKGSKPAAVIGVWFSNPVTIPMFYIGSYKLGSLFLGNNMPFDPSFESITELMKVGFDVTISLMLGGIVLAIPPAVATYFGARSIFTKIQEKRIKRRARKKAKSNT